ncbi:UNVERIFIED_CONTAM: hypothetical protein GTU68_030808 [Idotea baltica]|nr:hypothetical protein [Idotea baltica]
MEEKLIAKWEEQNIFRRSIDPRASTTLEGPEKTDTERPTFTFYDGPPFATGLPHYGHLLAGSIKDVVCRFFSMKGYHVPRRFGWDCHGVPVEFEIQKNLDIHGAKAIREFGIDKFNEECRKIVLRYTKEWEHFVVRSGRWIDFEKPYRTMDLEFMESIWWVLKTLWEKGLIYEGVKCVPYSPAINTPLSNFEANQNYKDIQDPAVTVRAKLDAESVSVLGWTTTPWTLPSNMSIAVGPELSYAAVKVSDTDVALVAEDLVESVLGEIEDDAKLATFSGKQLAGLTYTPFFPFFLSEKVVDGKQSPAFTIYTADYVTTDAGTGLVHLASFGEEDLAIFLKNGVPVIDPLDEDGIFDERVGEFSGLGFRESNPKIIAALKASGGLIKQETISHSYPFCYRTDTPLIYKSISTWFVNVESFKERMVACNQEITWVPEHVKDGRFGKWLDNARDWAISRNRFWGTPIPFWACDSCNTMECVGSVEELQTKSGQDVDDLHKHFVDDLTWDCSKCSGQMKRIPEVLDCWFESGSMPYAQQHYPFENQEVFESTFPADFIAEGLDQTRGWFYTLIALSTALFDKPAFKNVIVNGIVLAEDGRKMSKSLKNYPAPDKVMNEYGADALRLYLLSSAATRGEELKFSEVGVRDVVRQTLLPLWNAYKFFVTYANVDKWTPEQLSEDISDNVLDQWILSKTASLVSRVDTALVNYQLSHAAPPILDYVDQLTNWYIRLNRRRFWAGSSEAELADKRAAYSTLHRCILTFVRTLAPIAPFISEKIFQNLAQGVLDRDSVHLCPFPQIEEFSDVSVDSGLEDAMELFQKTILLARGLRNDLRLKTRQPLPKLSVIYSDAGVLTSLKRLEGYLLEELNVKAIEYLDKEEAYVALSAKLNTKKHGKTLGPKLGRDGMRDLQKKIGSLSTEEIRSIEAGKTLSFLDMEFGGDDLLLFRTPLSDKVGDAAVACDGRLTVLLDTKVDEGLKREGLAREFVNRVQKLRKELDFEVTDTIEVYFSAEDVVLQEAVVAHEAYIRSEVLAEKVELVASDKVASEAGLTPSEQEIEGTPVLFRLHR